MLKKNAFKLIKSKVLLDLKLLSWPKSIMFLLSIIDIIFEHPSLIAIWNCSRNSCMFAHLQKRWLTVSHSFPQNKQLLSFSIAICFRAMLIPNILCTSLIWNHFSFISWIFCIFLKVIHELIYNNNNSGLGAQMNELKWLMSVLYIYRWRACCCTCVWSGTWQSRQATSDR